MEKLQSWTDSGGDVESVLTRDELLTWITAYWVSGTIGTSFTPYVDKSGRSTGRIDVPTAFSLFPADLVGAPREFADRFFDVQDGRSFRPGGTSPPGSGPRTTPAVSAKRWPLLDSTDLCFILRRLAEPNARKRSAPG